ncbi:hypothetical protein CMI37_37175 [Candidatus Pacearchaeota archaeon]|nr:hypothetical protein [Candidatus Pacearchaeota archaeon]
MSEKLMKNRKGQISARVTGAVEAIILIVVLFLLFADLVPEAQSAGNELNESGVPLGTLFVGSGVVILLVMVGLLLTVLKVVLPGSRK